MAETAFLIVIGVAIGALVVGIKSDLDKQVLKRDNRQLRAQNTRLARELGHLEADYRSRFRR